MTTGIKPQPTDFLFGEDQPSLVALTEDEVARLPLMFETPRGVDEPQPPLA